MDTTSALFSVSLLLLIGVYGIYWLESRRGAGIPGDSEILETVPPEDPTD